MIGCSSIKTSKKVYFLNFEGNKLRIELYEYDKPNAENLIEFSKDISDIKNNPNMFGVSNKSLGATVLCLKSNIFF
jgi:hypothetical protein